MKALAVASGIVFWTLMLGVAWLAFFPGSGGEPVAVLQIDPGAAPAEPAEPAAPPAPDAVESAPQASPDAMGLPPGFAVGPQAAPPAMEHPASPMVPGGQPEMPAPPGGPDDATPPDAMDQQGAVPAEDPGMQQAAVDPAVPPPLPGPESETASITLPPVPVAELVEESQYGPLPKVAPDGRRPIDVYSRPSRYVVVPAGAPPRVAVLVTGFGLPDAPSPDVLKDLPAPVSVAYGAYGRGLQDGVSQVRAKGHEVLLQIPLEPNNYPTEDPGPHTLLTSLPADENLKRLQWLMSRYTGYVGVTNHMGAKFEASRNSLQPVFEEFKRRGLLFVDDGTVQGSAAPNIAGAIGLDYSAASVQIDAGDIAKQLEQLEAVATQQGVAIGVVRAKPATMKQLADWAGKLQAKGIVIVPVSAAVRSLRQS